MLQPLVGAQVGGQGLDVQLALQRTRRARRQQQQRAWHQARRQQPRHASPEAPRRPRHQARRLAQARPRPRRRRLRRKISTSQKDREFFECLYRFAAYVAFVTFRQKNLKEIQQEVGRLLRSNIFNPALREKTKPVELLKIAVGKEMKKTTFSFRKSTDTKQPAIRSVMDLRSPVLSTLLPMAKYSTQYLFQDHYLHPGKTAPSISPEDLPELSSIVTTSKIGIIGAPRNKFVPHTLLPLGSQDDEKEDTESQMTRTSGSSLISRDLTTALRSAQSSGSRPSLVISRTTTEADYLENLS